MDETVINNRLSLIGTYVFSQGFRPRTYFGQLLIREGQLILLSDNTTIALKFDISTLQCKETNRGNALKLIDSTGTYTVFFASELNDSEGVNPDLSITGVLIGWVIGLAKSRSPQNWLSKEQAAINKQYIQLIKETLAAYQNGPSAQPKGSTAM